MSAEYIVVLRIVCDDENDDPRDWNYDELLGDEQQKYVAYVIGEKVDRG